MQLIPFIYYSGPMSLCRLVDLSPVSLFVRISHAYVVDRSTEKSMKNRRRAGSDSTQFWLGLEKIKFTSAIKYLNNSESLVNKRK